MNTMVNIPAKKQALVQSEEITSKASSLLLNVITVLRLEGLAVLLAALYFYQSLNGNWWLFGLLFLIPDFSGLGYLYNKRVGAFCYNLIHNYTLSLTLIVVGQFLGYNWITLAGLILSSHLGWDHLLGYGLKYGSDVKRTHLQRI